MKCIECAQIVERLFEEPVKGNITLTQCPNCRKIADKFIEYEYTLIFLNLILCKVQVYRHLLFNISFCTDLIDLLNLFFLASLMDTILFSCPSLECWSREFISSILINLLYIGAIVFCAVVSGIQFQKSKLVRAVLVASFGKLGAVMIVTWKYSAFYRGMMSFFMYMNHVIAVKECLESSYLKALSFVTVAIIAASIDSVLQYYGMIIKAY
jgi:lipid intermediate transporter